MGGTTVRASTAALTWAVSSGLVWALRSAGVLEGAAALTLLLVALLSFPTATTLSGRILVTGCTVLGWNQMLWWWAVPGDRVGASLAVAVGLAVAVPVWRWPSGAGQGMCPRVAWADTIPGVVFVFGGLLLVRDLADRSPSASIGRLLGGWDNAGHFSMFRMLLSHGATVDALPPPAEGETWNYAFYPEAFHATTASLAQLMWSTPATDPGTLVVVYERAAALALTVSITVLIAGLAAQPWVRQRWEVALPPACLIAGTYLLGLGRSLADAGFSAFVFPCALAGAALFVMLRISCLRVSGILAIGGALAGVAHAWIPLLTLMAPVCVALVVPRLGLRWPTTLRGAAPVFFAFLLTSYACWRAIRILAANPNESLILTNGSIAPPHPTTLILLVVATPVLVIALLAKRRNAEPAVARIVSARLGVAAAVVPVGLVTAAALGGVQLYSRGALTYYFYKYLYGLEMMLVVLASATLGALLVWAFRTQSRSGWRSPVLGVLLTVLAAVGALNTDLIPSWIQPLPSPSDAERQGVASEILRAVRVPHSDDHRALYLASASPVNSTLPALWYLALEGKWTTAADAGAADLGGSHPAAHSVARLALRWLEKNDGCLVVAPDVRAAIRASRGGSDLVHRLHSW